MSGRAVAAAVAVVLGAGAGWAVQDVVQDHREERYRDYLRADAAREQSLRELAERREVGDRVRAAAEGLRDDRVYVSPDGRAMLDEEGEAAVARALAASELPAYVVVWAHSRLDGTADFPLADQLAEVVEGPAVVYVWAGPQQGEVIDLGLSYYPFEPPQVGDPTDFVGDPATTLVRSLEDVEAGDFAVDEPEPEGGNPSEEDDSSDYWGGLAGGVLAGLLFGGAGAGFVLAGRAVLRAGTRRRRGTPRGRITA